MSGLTVVVICKDQEWNIGRLIESVFAADANSMGVEVVVVDSASTDRTVEIACGYPVRVFRIHPEERLTASLGRFVGFRESTGDLVLFLDGDMELCRGWISRGVQVLAENPDAAAVCGDYVDVSKEFEGSHPAVSAGCNDEGVELIEVSYTGGAALYDRKILQKTGSFNPFLHGEEEPELGLRARGLGYRFFKLGCPMVVHYTDPIEDPSTLIGRWRRNLYCGHGQVIRYHFNNRLIWSYLKERQYISSSIGGIFVGFTVLAVTAFTGQLFWSVGFLLLIGAVFAVLVYRNRSVRKTFSTLLNRLLAVLGIFAGLVKKAPATDTFRPRVERVQ